ncbi:MAG: hypothetical protein ACKOW2_03490 [Sphingobacteriaceae bacterium]
MKIPLNTLTLILLFLIFSACNKDKTDVITDCACAEQQVEYVCWIQNGNNKFISNLYKQVDDVFAQGLRHYAFQDLNGDQFYLEFEWPTEIVIGQTYNLDLETGGASYDFDYGFGATTVFHKGTFLLEENTATYIKGKFSASDARVNGIPDPSITITSGCFKLYK